MSYRVFISSPGDVAEERKRAKAVVDDLEHILGVPLRAWVWEDEVSPGDGPPQGLVDEALDSYDIYVGIMWKRLGSQTPAPESGTAAEYRRARRLLREGSVRRVMFYFCTRAIALDEHAAQVGDVLRFRA